MCCVKVKVKRKLHICSHRACKATLSGLSLLEWRVKFLKKLWCRIGGEVRRENLASNESARVKLPP